MARADMFLKATGQRTGEILGESRDRNFTNQIEVVDWSWGMSAPSAVGGQRAGRTLLKEIRLVKRVDKASTALMSVLKSNELLSTAVLSVRKAGGSAPLPYFVLTLDQARITAYDVQSVVDEDGAPVLTEVLNFAFKRISIAHTVQNAEGASLGASSFTGETAPE